MLEINKNFAFMIIIEDYKNVDILHIFDDPPP